jgi:aspartate racemase
MKTIGMIGGMSWESTLEYYRIANETVKAKLGEKHSVECVLYSVEFGEVERLQHEGDWKALTDLMVEIARKLKRAGADFIVICTNTMHLMAEDIEREVGIEVLHIAKATGKKISESSLKKIALLGTRFTMESDFYPQILMKDFGIETITPMEKDKEIVHHIIYDELIKGIFRDESREAYQGVIERLKERGAEGVILGCTEIPLLIKQKDSSIPVFDTTEIHAIAAVEYALK